jgi:hypothetical protein
LFEATVEAVEESIVNALVAGETMTGRDNHVVEALPIPRLQEILAKYHRLSPPLNSRHDEAPPARAETSVTPP